MVTSTYRRLLERRWTILHSPGGMDWVLPDHPAVGYLNGRFFGLDPSVGWLHKGIELFMPLSPTHLLYSKQGEYPKQKGTTVNSKEAERLNRLLIKRAHRFIVSKEFEPLIQKLRPREVNPAVCDSDVELWNTFNTTNRNAIDALGQPISEGEIAQWSKAR